MLQLVKAGDIDFAIISSANTATISPQAGVMSLHFLFRDEDHVIKGLADPKVFEALKTMIDETTQGLHVIATGSQGVRHMYCKKEIHKVGDIKGLKVRVQATATEDTMFPAYGAQTVHMPFGSVYTSLQTGVVDVAENSINVYLVNKHYEVAPVSRTDRARGQQRARVHQRQALAEPLGRAEEVGAGGGGRGQRRRSRRRRSTSRGPRRPS